MDEDDRMVVTMGRSCGLTASEARAMDEDDRMVVTTVLLDARTWRLLRELAMLRAERLGGRPSQSAVIRDLVVKESRARD